MWRFTRSTPDRCVSVDYVVEEFARHIRARQDFDYSVWDSIRYRGYIYMSFPIKGEVLFTRVYPNDDEIHLILATEFPSLVEIAFAIGRLLG